MQIAGLQKVSLIDYPGKIAAVVFTQGCNLCCPFCHNRDLVDPKARPKLIPEKEIFQFLKKRRGLLDGVVITGGEPTLQADLSDFITQIKRMGYLIKLDTNGTDPSQISKLKSQNLIDYIAMDIKGPLDKYHRITGSKIDLENIKESVEIIKNLSVSPRLSQRKSARDAVPDYEFRTTVVPGLLDKKDFVAIGKWLKGTKRYYLQQFRNQKTLDPKFQKIQPYPPEKLQEFAEIMKKYVKEVEIRGL